METLARPVEQKVTHTHTSDKGVVLVITDVPALVYEDEYGVRQVKYKGAASRVVTSYIKQALELFSEPTVHSTSFEEAKSGISVDARICFVGHEISLYNSSIKTWRDATNRLYQSYDVLRRALVDFRGLERVPYPTIRAIGSGSLIFGLKAKPEPALPSTQGGLFPPSMEGVIIDDPIPEEIQILRLLIDGHTFVMQKQVDNNLIQNYPQIRLAVVGAVERLSPKPDSEIEEIQVIPKSAAIARTEPVTFTPVTHQKARHLKVDLEAGSPNDDKRNVTIVGQIDTLSRQGRMTIKNIELNYPEGTRYTTTAIFHDSIFGKLTDFFKNRKRVVFKGVEYRTNDRWTSEPIIKEIEEAPPPEEVNRLV